MNAKELNELVRALQSRFEANMHRHKDLTWSKVLSRLESAPSALTTLRAMDASGGEPDVIGQDNVTEQVIFCDCSAESPSGRRSLCYDAEALNARRENKPEGSAT